MVSTIDDDQDLSTVENGQLRGRESLVADSRSGSPATATTEENIDCIHHMVMDNKRLTIDQIPNVISISCERIENILHNEHGMTKVSARWAPCLVTPDQKSPSLIKSLEYLILFG
ncbi:protein GVQW3-like [Octopus sinensis]|uniref:Protein GVQW3-like n=1 Tax=Octopus sinensis TaxID=2607531 RepID=A0A6P7SPB0_9MOLL|nr:protein GVQW3-like [Octopus sinensis]